LARRRLDETHCAVDVDQRAILALPDRFEESRALLDDVGRRLPRLFAAGCYATTRLSMCGQLKHILSAVLISLAAASPAFAHVPPSLLATADEVIE
jgi:hypothetical protein